MSARASLKYIRYFIFFLFIGLVLCGSLWLCSALNIKVNPNKLISGLISVAVIALLPVLKSIGENGKRELKRIPEIKSDYLLQESSFEKAFLGGMPGMKARRESIRRVEQRGERGSDPEDILPARRGSFCSVVSARMCSGPDRGAGHLFGNRMSFSISL